jgi:hypothetical protein
MPIKQDLLSYHRSVGRQIQTEERRIRDLIGSSHWGTDGAHKESVLRNIIRNFAPEIFRIGTGFVCYPSTVEDSPQNSSQIDILITSKDSPTLYRNEGLHIVTPECVKALIEVKTNVSNGEKLDLIIERLSLDARNVREKADSTCWAGLFIYNQGSLTDENVLSALQRKTNSIANGAINCVAVGDSLFVRFWPTGHPRSGVEAVPMWHSYTLLDLAKAYFVSNLISHLSPGLNDVSSDAWFPIQNTKEPFRSYYAKLSERVVVPFAGG